MTDPRVTDGNRAGTDEYVGGLRRGTCPDCAGTGMVYEDSMSVVGVPGGLIPVDDCPSCEGTGKEHSCRWCPHDGEGVGEG